MWSLIFLCLSVVVVVAFVDRQKIDFDNLVIVSLASQQWETVW